MKQLLLWFRIIRPQTLFASVCPVCIGLIVSPLACDWRIAIITLVCAIALQVLSNLINDYYDFKKGADKAGRAGFKRVLAEGEVGPKQMLVAIGITLAIALGTGLWLVCIGGWPILIIGLTALLFAWLYTATRFSLSYLGIADIFVFLYYGVIAAMGTCYLQGNAFFYWPAFAGGSVCGLISMCVLIINNLRDREADSAVGKRTFVVRFGKRAGEIAMLVYVLLCPLLAYLAFDDYWMFSMVIFLLILWKNVRDADGKAYNTCLLTAGICNLLYVLLACI